MATGALIFLIFFAATLLAILFVDDPPKIGKR